MRLLYEVRNDPARPGVALIVVPAAAGRAEGAVDLVIAGDDAERPYLGPLGWQPVEYRWRTGPVRVEGSDLLAPVGERVTVQLDDFTTLKIRFPALGLEGVLTWQGVTPPSVTVAPSGDVNAGAGSSFLIEAAPPAPPPEPESAQAPQPEPEPAPTPTPTPEPKPGREEPVNRTPVYVGAGLLLALLIAVGTAYALRLGPFAPPAAAPSAQADTSPPPVQPPVQPQPPAQTPPIETPPVAAPTPAERQTQAMTAVAESRFDEAARLLNGLEASNYGPALLYRARLIDSVEFVPGLSARPDDGGALLLYAAACRAGQSARPDLERLERALQDKADDGDAVAGEILRTELPKAKLDCR